MVDGEDAGKPREDDEEAEGPDDLFLMEGPPHRHPVAAKHGEEEGDEHLRGEGVGVSLVQGENTHVLSS